MNPNSVTITGAGLSGLVCGMRLAKAGFSVNIVEELTYPGGLLACTRIGKEYLEHMPHHLRRTDRALLALIKEAGIAEEVDWFDSLWYGRASRKKVGYLKGGFASLINSLIQDITDHGGRITYSTTVSEIIKTDDGYITSCILNNSAKIELESKYVIFTGSCRSFVNVSHGLPISMNLRDQLMNITYKASLCIMMVLKKKPSEVYLHKLPEGMPFNRIVNHSNCVGTRSYGGNIVYLVGACTVSDNLWVASDEEVLEEYFRAFRKIYPGIKKSDIKSWRLTKSRYAVSERFPDQDLTHPLEGLYICSSALTNIATSDTPNNTMDSVVNLANEITKTIIATMDNSEKIAETTSLSDVVAGG